MMRTLWKGRSAGRPAVLPGIVSSAVAVFILLCGVCGETTMSDAEPAKQIVGRLELARICPEGFELKAKLDTGAKNSSINAKNIAEFKKDGESWARFEVTNHTGGKVVIERKVLRVARIKQHGRDHLERPVVLMELCVGNVCREAEVNLQDRGRFLYPLLIGRSYMQGRIVIDPDVIYTASPVCRGTPAK